MTIYYTVRLYFFLKTFLDWAGITVRPVQMSDQALGFTETPPCHLELLDGETEIIYGVNRYMRHVFIQL